MTPRPLTSTKCPSVKAFNRSSPTWAKKTIFILVPSSGLSSIHFLTVTRLDPSLLISIVFSCLSCLSHLIRCVLLVSSVLFMCPSPYCLTFSLSHLPCFNVCLILSLFFSSCLYLPSGLILSLLLI